MIDRIFHTTLTLGGSARWSHRSECAPQLLAELRPIIAECERDGIAELPSPSGLMHLQRIEDADRPSRHVAIWAIREPQGPALVTMALAMKARVGAGLWRTLHAGAAQQEPLRTDAGDVPPSPWLAVMLHLPAILPVPHPAIEWLGDAERCIAWAWIDEVWADD